MKERFIYSARWACGIIIALNMILSLIFASQPIPIEHLVWALVLVFWLLVSSCIVAVSLPLLYWRHITDWKVWSGILGLMVVSGMVTSQIISLPNDGLMMFLTILHPVSILMIAVAIIILSVRRDVGLLIIACISIALVWSLVFVWLYYGNIFELSLRPIQMDEPQPLTLLFSLILQAICFVPFAIFGFLWWTVRLIYREVNQKSPTL